MPSAIPGVEIADHGHACGVWSPDGETHAMDAVNGHALRAKYFSKFEMPALVEQEEIEVAEQQPERIRIFSFLNRLRPMNPQQIGSAVADKPFEQSARIGVCERCDETPVGPSQDIYLDCAGKEGADNPTVRAVLRSEHRKRIRVHGDRQRADGFGVQLPGMSHVHVNHRGLRFLFQ